MIAVAREPAQEHLGGDLNLAVYLGVRIALDAEKADGLLMTIRQGLLPTLQRIVAGLGIAQIFIRTLAGLSYGITATDPMTYLGV